MSDLTPTKTSPSAPPSSSRDDRIPYQKPQPFGMKPDLVIKNALEADPRLWAPLSEGITSRPIMLNVSAGYYVHLMRVTRSGLLQRHRHSGQVHAYVLRGEWHYLEHDWRAQAGDFIFEPPGETHTLVVPEHCQEMLTLFTVYGSLMYVDPYGQAVGYDDVFTRIEKYKAHFEHVGLAEDTIEQFIR